MKPTRRLDLEWIGPEIHDYETMKQRAEIAGNNLSQYVKNVLCGKRE